MNTLLLIMLSLVEIGLVVLTFSENRGRATWYLNRMAANIIEILAYIVFAFFPGIDYSFRFKGLLVVLIIRAIIAVVAFLVNRKRKGKMKTARVIISAVLGIVIIAGAMLPSYMFNDYNGIAPSGSYGEKTAQAILIDTTRIEEFETDGSFREVPVDFYYPDAGEDSVEKYPLVVFSHGAFGFSRSNYSLYQELVSHGYVVVSLSHPYHSFFCKDTSGNTITVNPEFMNSTMYINDPSTSEDEIFNISSKWIELRMNDMNFAIDTLKRWQIDGDFNESWYLDGNDSNVREVMNMIDFDKIALIGHSLGGATAVSVGRNRTDVSAVVDLDGTMLGEQIELVDCEPYEFEGKIHNQKYICNEDPYPVAILNIDNDEHHHSRIAAKEVGMPYANNAVMDNAVCGYDTYMIGAGHMNLTDLPLFSPFLADMLGTGDTDAKECITTINQLVLRFFDDKLKGKEIFTVEESYGD